jgi:hypothetical protein
MKKECRTVTTRNESERGSGSLKEHKRAQRQSTKTAHNSADKEEEKNTST